eukprot:GHVL01009674.1.p1 GENE.GHVL01009674.1~~GHVL01009674.1.p1  ORF type:complete len:456 (-),score=93.86 GHVL01009674.1:1752-3119(-)
MIYQKMWTLISCFFAIFMLNVAAEEFKCDGPDLVCCKDEDCTISMTQCGCPHKAPKCTSDVQDATIQLPQNMTNSCTDLWTQISEASDNCPELSGIDKYFEYLDLDYNHGCPKPTEEFDELLKPLADACDSCSIDFVKNINEFINDGCMKNMLDLIGDEFVEEYNEIYTNTTSTPLNSTEISFIIDNWKLGAITYYNSFTAALDSMCEIQNGSQCGYLLSEAPLLIFSQPFLNPVASPDLCQSVAKSACCDLHLSNGLQDAVMTSINTIFDDLSIEYTPKSTQNAEAFKAACKELGHPINVEESCPSLVMSPPKTISKQKRRLFGHWGGYGGYRRSMYGWPGYGGWWGYWGRYSPFGAGGGFYNPYFSRSFIGGGLGGIGGVGAPVVAGDLGLGGFGGLGGYRGIGLAGGLGVSPLLAGDALGLGGGLGRVGLGGVGLGVRGGVVAGDAVGLGVG